jgi:hypothetical protein
MVLVLDLLLGWEAVHHIPLWEAWNKNACITALDNVFDTLFEMQMYKVSDNGLIEWHNLHMAQYLMVPCNHVIKYY